MAKDFSFSLENRVGSGAQTLEALGQAGINLLGACAVSGGAVVHLAVEDQDADAARQALEGAGVQIEEERDVLLTPVEDRPGAAAAVLRRVADAGVNLDFLYLASNTRLVLGTEDLQRAQAAL